MDYATPRDGWDMKVEESGPDSVSVSFSRDDHESQLSAECEEGRPAGETEEKAEHGGHHK
ncbi:MAG: hypothetical protein WAK18_03910 [Nocardioidaceae bacterium]